VRWLALSLLVSVGIECLGMAFWWPEAGVEHSRSMLQAELGFLKQDVRESFWSDDPARFAASWAERARYVLVELTGIKRVSAWIAQPEDHKASAIRSSLRRLGRAIAPYAEAVLTIAQVFAVRLAILILALPTFALFSLVGLVDGLVRRDLRRWGGGRESSYLYHYAKQSVWRFVVIAGIIYLASPISVHPALVLMPFATLFAISIGITASTFKKYL
jgi:integrating conjugative element membrane protein (TIGR03747 family)